jgi:type IV pilus assembly protein PilM
MNLRSLLRQPVLTIAIHEHDLRWTIGRRGRIASCGRVPLPAGLIDDGKVTDPELAGHILRDDPAFRGSARMQVVVALPAQRSVFRQIDVPTVSPRQFAQLAEREIRREMPMLVENAHVSWSRAGTHGVNTSVFVVGVARDVLDSHVASVRAAGLTPMSADLRIIAAARAVGEPDCVIASVEDDEVELGIFRDGVPSIIRFVAMSAPCGELAWFEQLGEELARTLKFYRDSHRGDEAVKQLPLTFVGSAAQQARLAPQISEATGHELSMPPLRLIVEPEQQSMAFAVNIGLALKDLAA